MARHALVVGLSQYPYIPTKYPPYNASLKQPPIDAEKVAQILEQHGKYTVNRLPQRWNKQTQKYEIDPQESVSDLELASALKILLKELPENGASIEGLVYFAGHGFTFNSNLGVEKGVIATSNTKITMKDEQVIDYQNAVSFSDLNDVIKKSNLQSLVLILDCCHSGYFIEKEMTNNSLRTAFNNRNYYCISACRTREKSHVLDGEDHSIFSRAVIDGLNASQANQQGKITGDRLYDYIQSELTVKGPKFGQTAIKMGWGEGITIVSYPDKAERVDITFNSNNPYLGLLSFDSKDKLYFYGREEAIADLVSHLNDNRFLVVIGSSGSGKSSLIKAGLLPKLKDNNIIDQIKIMTPGDHPLETLKDKLDYLGMYQNTLLFIDQCEEIFTLCKDQQKRQEFFQLIAKEASNSQRLSRVLVAIRGDFLDQCAKFPDVATLINRVKPSTYCVQSLSRKQLKLAIEKPAELHGVNLESDLADEIIADVFNRESSLPLLEYALKELWRVCITNTNNTNKMLTWQGYQKIGKVAGALNQQADNIYYNKLAESAQELVKQLFLELVEIGDETTVTKGSVQKDSLINENPKFENIINILTSTEYRLITINDQKNAKGDYRYIELAHECLFEEWSLLKSWIDENRDSLRIKRRFENDYQDWLKHECSSGYLLLEGKLGTVEDWITKHQPQLSPEQRKFFDLSMQRRDHERLEKEENQRRLLEEENRAIAAELTAQQEKNKAIKAQLQAEKAKAQKQKIITWGIIAIGIFGLLVWRSNLITNADSWLKQAKAYDDDNQQLEAMMASVKSLNQLKRFPLNLFVKFGDEKKITEQIRSIVENIKEKNRIQQDSSINALSIRLKDNVIATGTEDGKVNLWNFDGQHLTLPTSISGSIYQIVFSPNGRLLVTGMGNGNIHIFKEQDKYLKNTIVKAHTDHVTAISFSKSNTVMASSSSDGNIKLWSISNDQLQEKLTKKFSTDPKYSIYTLDIAPFNESIIVYADSLGEIVQWNYETGQTNVIGNFKAEEKAIIKFSPNGSHLAFASVDGTIKIGKCQKVESKCQITEKNSISTGNQIYTLSFSSNEQLLAIAGDDEKIKIFSVNEFVANKGLNSTKELYLLVGHTGYIPDLKFLQNDHLLASVSEDKTLRIWQYEKSFNHDDNPLKYSCNFLKDYLNNNSVPDWFEFKKECPQ